MTKITPDYILASQKDYKSRKTRAYNLLKNAAAQLGYKGTEGFDDFCDDADAAGGVVNLIDIANEAKQQRDDDMAEYMTERMTGAVADIGTI